MAFTIDRPDRLVLMVADPGATTDFYTRALGMQAVGFGDRKALTFVGQKINLRQRGHEHEPKAAHPTPGSAGLCFITVHPLPEVIRHLARLSIQIEEGPVEKTGAAGKLLSIYSRDPDGNRIEISNCVSPMQAREEGAATIGGEHSQAPAAAQSPATGATPHSSRPAVRIVSLLASATEIICALGAGEMLVGRSHECDNPAWVASLPPCSTPAFDVSVSSGEIDREVRRRIRSGEPLYHIHAELIRRLHPDLLLTQVHCEVCAVTPGDVERGGGSPARQLALSASSLEDIFQSILGISRELGLEERGEALVHRERQRLEMVREKVARFRRPSVVMLEWTDPLFAMGNWGPELVEIAGGELLIGKKGEYSAAISATQVRDADPEYLIVAPCGFNLQRTLREQAVLERYPWWPSLQAVRNRNVAFADGNMFFNRSGMTISQTAEIIAEILHGVSFGAAAEGVHWRRIASSTSQDSPRPTPSQT